MIDLNESQKTQALLKEWCNQGMESISTTVKYGQLLDLMNRLASEEKDAARYRWLRECNWNESTLCVVTNPKESVKLGTYCPSVDRLDSAIDEAMKCGGDNK